MGSALKDNARVVVPLPGPPFALSTATYTHAKSDHMRPQTHDPDTHDVPFERLRALLRERPADQPEDQERLMVRNAGRGWEKPGGQAGGTGVSVCAWVGALVCARGCCARPSIITDGRRAVRGGGLSYSHQGYAKYNDPQC